MIWSPVRMPAAWAGDCGFWPGEQGVWALDGTQDTTVTTVVVGAVAEPMPTASTHSSTNAMTKCMNEPADSTITRCQAGLARRERDSSAGSTSSRLVIPVILTNPPTGNAFTPYSVSPRCLDQMVGPNPTKNCVAFTPNALAVAKCPISCNM